MLRTDFQERSKNDHVSLRPEMYVGTMYASSRTVFVMEGSVQKQEDVLLSPGLVRILIEILCNAADNANESREEGLDPGCIEVSVKGDVISVTNGGRPLPIEKMGCDDGSEEWIPTVMFSRMFSSSHYDDTKDRTTAGLYGVGAKACNTLSVFFSIIVRDGRRQLVQTWSNGGMEQSVAVVTSSKESPLVTVSFTPDMKRFPESIILQSRPDIVSKLASDLALNCLVPVAFSTESTSVVYDYRARIKPAMDMRMCVRYISRECGGHRVFVLDSPTLTQESFVNCTPTYNHGTHVDALMSVLRTQLRTVKGMEKVNKKILMSAVSFVVCSTVVRPRFDGNNKDYLSSPITDMEWPDMLKEITKTIPQVLERIKRALLKSEMIKMNKGNKKLGFKKELKNANYAGKIHRTNRPVSLWITEGRSASTYAKDIISSLYGNFDHDGVLSIRGKPLNVSNCEMAEITSNQEINTILAALGIQVGVDYSSKEARSKLRYSRVVIASDADDDGYHIRLLLINLLREFAPTLLGQSFIVIMNSPRIRLDCPTKQIIFYTEDEWVEWQRQHPTGWSKKSVTYCKGLGSSSPEDTYRDAEEGEQKILRRVTAPDQSSEALTLAFDKSACELRKEWLIGDLVIDTDNDPMSIPSLVQKELREYSLQTLKRAIPGMDGLVESQRMLIWTMMKHSGKKKCDVILGNVLTTVNYKHGPTSMYGALAGMAAGYPGSNNLPLIQPDGNLGTRNLLGKDLAGARYPSASLRPFVKYVFRDEDLPVLQLKVENGSEYEPLLMLPVIPLWLVNTVAGISTGWSTFIPPHNPHEIILHLRHKLNERLEEKGLVTPPESPREPLYRLEPWFRYFEGSVDLKMADDEVNDEDEDGVVWKIKPGDRVMVVRGKRSTTTRGDGKHIHIREIPVYQSLDGYALQLAEYCHEKGYEIVKDNCNRTVDIELVTPVHSSVSNRDLGLMKRRSLANMHILDHAGFPRRFESAEEGIDVFLEWRLPFYEKRRQSQLEVIREKVNVEEEYHSFLEAVLDGAFNPVAGRHVTSQAQYRQYLEDNGYSMRAAEKYRAWDNRTTLEDSLEKIRKLNEEASLINSISWEQMMISDLDDLVVAIDKYYKSKEATVDVFDPKRSKTSRRR